MATEKRDLRTGRTVWQGRRFHRVSAKPLRGDRTTDVLIVGAGITGAVVAQALAADGHAVMLVDRRGPAAGATAASTALVQYEIDMPLTLLSRRIGKEKAMRAWRRSRLALDSLAATLATLNVPDVARRDTLYLAGDVLDPAALRREGAARRAAGLETRYLTRGGLRKTFGIRAQAALMGYGNLAIDPCRSTHALLNDAVAHGATIFAPAEITDIEANARQVFAATRDGARIRTRTLIFASGYEMPHGVPMRGHKIISTWAFATAPQPKRLWPGEALIWEAADPYLYIRTTRDGRVICGGEDEEFSDEKNATH